MKARALTLLSYGGLLLSLATLALITPRLFRDGGGASTVLANSAAGAWTLLVLWFAFSATRTLQGKAVLSAWLAGFFGCTSLATLVGRPVLDALGATSQLAVTVVVPLTEELIKLLPVAVLVVLGVRNQRYRPSATDGVLYGAAVGAGFTVFENALYARGPSGPFEHVPFSLVLPSVQTSSSYFVGGHTVYTGLAALGLSVAVMYRRRSRLAWLAAPLALAIVVAEHAVANQLSLHDGPSAISWWARVLRVLTLDGYLATLVLVAGSTTLAVCEYRALRRTGLVPAMTRQALVWPSARMLAGRRPVLALVQSGLDFTPTQVPA